MSDNETKAPQLASSAEAEDKMIGALVGGRYKIARLLGTGNMARVYVAEQVNMERNVAVKLLQPELLVDETAGGRFQREVVAVSRLRSPHTISFIDSGCTPEGVPYIVMELLVGQTLRERLEEDNPIPWHEVVTVVEQLGHSLHEAHEAGVLHRDLKPDNVHYSHQPTPFQPFIKLLDFGLAKLLDPQNENDMMLTARRQTVGTPAYMAPEMIVEERPVDHRSDIYALGVMCLEMLTGQRPYQHKGTMQMAMAQVRDPIPSARAINPALPEGADAFFESVMAKDPAHRPQSAIELAGQLRALLFQG
ncbi:MAG: serine/threonine protein kinase [Kofleriaceae bacterium]|nr:serine/threonine protein kinase [Kofleriaceae bacterium]